MKSLSLQTFSSLFEKYRTTTVSMQLCVMMCVPTIDIKQGLVAQWITRLTTDQKILGSTPG